MKRIRELILKLVLPLTIILFGTITKWRYVFVEDGPDDFLYGFPLTFLCSGWHTSMSLQIFVLELLFNFFVYFAICVTIIIVIDKYLKQIIVGKIMKFSLYGFAIITLTLYGFVFSNPDNIYVLKRDFKYKEIRSGYKLVWQQDKR